jgi:hypothetical protein
MEQQFNRHKEEMLQELDAIEARLHQITETMALNFGPISQHTQHKADSYSAL